MKLKVMVPTEIVVDEPATKVIAEAEDGQFCLLPRHIDFVAALVPGLLAFTDARGEEVYLAVDEGTLVKRDREVLVSVRHALRGESLEALHETLRRQFHELDEHERAARTALAKLEADAVRRFLELGSDRR
ncbi:F0F1 ATP synthase subunit epsilon [Endothiovibrio diazotrophicus]